ncbi:unnamed protein product, partial [Brassica oleracea var. botrytis]
RKNTQKERERSQDSHGVRWRVRARTGADGFLPCYSVQVLVSLFRSVASLRHARRSGLGLCTEKIGSLQIFFFWIRGEERGDKIVSGVLIRDVEAYTALASPIKLPGCGGS